MKTAGRRVSEGLAEGARRIVNPPFLEESLESARRPGQFLAAALLVVFLPVSLTLIKIAQRLLITLFLDQSLTGDSESAPFMITLVTLGMLVGVLWLSFQWVRSAGFGYLKLDLGGQA